LDAAAGAANVSLTFDEATHTYRYNGEKVDSVTQIIEAAGLTDFSMVDRETLRLAQERGTRVHAACALDDMGALDDESVDPSELGYLAAWRIFRSTVVARIEAVEQAVYHPTLRYAGRLDVLLTTFAGQQWIVDRKTGDPHPATGVQLAGYLLALGPKELRRGRYAVHLREDGTYRLEAYRDAADFSAFTAALTLTNWKQRK
jgi:hypothetical protein